MNTISFEIGSAIQRNNNTTRWLLLGLQGYRYLVINLFWVLPEDTGYFVY
jgi:hypothetical protein